MAALRTIGTFLLGLALFVAIGVFYTVNEGTRALVLRLGEIKTGPDGQALIVQPGLHLKYPFVNSVAHLDVRLRTMDVKKSRILSGEQKYVLVDYYAKWRIEDLPKFYTSTGGIPGRAEALLSQKINNSLRAAFGQLKIGEVISGQRLNVMTLLKDEASKSAKELGISVIDVRIKRIDLPAEVSGSVFQRMAAKREQVATKHRSDGEAAANTIRAKADASVTISEASARREAAEIRARGLADAARIYADAFTQDPEFYSFHRSLEAYRHTFNNKHDLLLIQPNGDFFKYFSSMKSTGNAKAKS